MSQLAIAARERRKRLKEIITNNLPHILSDRSPSSNTTGENRLEYVCKRFKRPAGDTYQSEPIHTTHPGHSKCASSALKYVWA